MTNSKQLTTSPLEIESQAIGFFLKNRGITNDQGELLDFKDHPYLKDIYTDFTPKQCIKKSAQVGLSTTIVIKAIWVAAMKKMDIIYSFPTFDMARKMVSSKVNRLIANNPVFQDFTQDQDSIEQKRIGKNVMYFQGTSNEQAAIALPADLYIADEVDRSDQAVVEQFASRLQHSKFGWEWRFSNPSVTENGVDKWWQESDQKEWFVRCSGCNRDQILTLDHMATGLFRCEKCGKELDRHIGKWIKRFKEREISGYHVSALMSPMMKPETINGFKKDKSEQFFMNFVMGEPYIGSGNYLPRHILFSNLTSNENPQDDIPVIGVDTGKKIHYVVGNKYGLFFNGYSNGYEEVERILKSNPKAIAVIDQGGDITKPRELQDKYYGRVYLCTFVQAQDVTPRWKEEIQMVNVDRNKAIQLLVDEFHEHRIPLFGIKDDWSMYADHWGHLYREIEEDERGRRRFIWKRNGDDHLALATVYWRLGMDKFSGGDGEILMPDQNLFPNRGMDTFGNYATLKRL